MIICKLKTGMNCLSWLLGLLLSRSDYLDSGAKVPFQLHGEIEPVKCQSEQPDQSSASRHPFQNIDIRVSLYHNINGRILDGRDHRKENVEACDENLQSDEYLRNKSPSTEHLRPPNEYHSQPKRVNENRYQHCEQEEDGWTSMQRSPTIPINSSSHYHESYDR